MGFGMNSVSPAGNVFMTIVYSKHPSEPRMLVTVRGLGYRFNA